MKIIHYVNALPRLVSCALAERLAVMPAVVVTGARQTGKSTLAEQLVQGKRLYRTLDDFDVLDAARRGAGHRSEPQCGSLPADRFGEPALHAPGFRIARWPRGDAHEEDWRALAHRGGFPTPAIELARSAERAIWFDGYVACMAIYMPWPKPSSQALRTTGGA